MGENPTKYKITSPSESVANAGHRAVAVKLCTARAITLDMMRRYPARRLCSQLKWFREK
jgi:hypothetical protein